MIRNTILPAILILASLICNAQNKDADTITITTEDYKLIRRNSGMQIGVGVAKYFYGQETRSWIGNHGGPAFSFQFNLGRHNIGGRFKPWTVNPKAELSFDKGGTLSSFANLNVIKGEWFYGYDIQIIEGLIAQPFIGYISNSFVVINEDELSQSYEIPKTRGGTLGLEIKKYFRIGIYQYLIPYINISGAKVNYEKVHPSLSNNFYSVEFGIKYGGWFSKRVVIE